MEKLLISATDLWTGATPQSFVPMYINSRPGSSYSSSGILVVISTLIGICFWIFVITAVVISVKNAKAGNSSNLGIRSPQPQTYKNFAQVIRTTPTRPNPQSSYYTANAEYNQNLSYANDNSSATSRILSELKKTGRVDHDIFAEDDQITALYKAGIIGKDEFYSLRNRLGE